MLFDITTPDSAYLFIQDFLGVTFEEFIDGYVVECNRDLDVYLEGFIDRIKVFDVDDMGFKVFHVTTNGDECSEIKARGLINTQRVLSEDTQLRALLARFGLRFDVQGRSLFYKESRVDLNLDQFRGVYALTDDQKKVYSVARKIYSDYQINAFFASSNVFEYGSYIHLRPEIFVDLVNLFPALKRAEDTWVEKSQAYAIYFIAQMHQLEWDSFYGNKNNYLDDEDKTVLKKRLISMAAKRSFQGLYDYAEECAFIKPQCVITPNQIVSIDRISCPR